MTIQDSVERFEIIQQRLVQSLPGTFRPFFKTLKPPGRAVILTGARGTGKTTYLLGRLNEGHFLYLSADNPLASAYPLYDLIEAVFLRGYEGIYIDEIHYAPSWARDLKAAYDAFPGKTIWASDSSTLALRGGISDISRRFLFVHLPLLSFREFIALTTGIEHPAFDAFDPKPAAAVSKKTNVLKLFREYLDHGFRPMFLEGVTGYASRIMALIEKALSSDVPFLVPQLSEHHLRFMNAVVGYLAVSKVPVLAVNSLSQQWGLGKEKLYRLLEAMESAGVIRIVRIENDRRIHTAGRKMFLYEPSVYGFLGGNIGTLRESYVVGIAVESGRKVYASADETKGDFVIDGRVIEVGGLSKSKKGADFVLRDDLELPHRSALPLWVWGFGY